MKFVFTSDVDFVSDSVLQTVYKSFDRLPLTIFMTGKSQYLQSEIFNQPFWELEPHPNFCKNSSHGDSCKEVLNNVKNFCGQGIGFRCHRYYTSNDIMEMMQYNGYRYSSNLCTNLQTIQPFENRCKIIEFPIFFEDGGYLKYNSNLDLNYIKSKMDSEGIYVFNFHPIHLLLNSSDFITSRKIKDSLSYEQYSNLTAEDFEKYHSNKYGINNLLEDLIEYANGNNVELLNLRQCYERYKNNSF